MIAWVLPPSTILKKRTQKMLVPLNFVQYVYHITAHWRVANNRLVPRSLMQMFDDLALG